MSSIRVAIVEDDLGWLNAIISYLNKQEDMIIVGTATNVSEAIEIVKSTEIDVFLADINLSKNKCDGIYLAAELLQVNEKLKIIMVTSLKEKEIVYNSVLAGAVNYISKENYLQIPNAIREAYNNIFSPMVALKDEISRLRRSEILQRLSASEKEVFELLEQGYTQSQVETILFKSHNTIKSQVKSILRKFDMKSIKDIIRYIGLNGLIDKDTMNEK